jgi:hypothetical protein
MPKGAYTAKQERKADHIAEGYEKRGVGKKEAETRQVSIRRLGSDKQQVMSLDDALKLITEEALPPDVKRERAAG